MAQVRHLNKPPIREAILELRIAPFINIIPESLAQWSIPETYPPVKIQQEIGAGFQLTQNFTFEPMPSEKIIDGGIFHDPTRHVAVQAMRNHLTINKLTPYTDFTFLKNEAQHFWKQYRTSFFVENIERVSLRFINEIIPEKPLQYYILPEFLPQGALPNQTTNAYYRYELRRSETLGALIQIVVENDSIKFFPMRLTLDIDTYSTRAYQASDDAVWEEAVEQLHTFKNELFFAMITEDFAKECE